MSELVSQIEATGVLDEEEGCYTPKLEASDVETQSFVLRKGEALHRYQAEDAAGPDAAVAALGEIKSFIDGL